MMVVPRPEIETTHEPVAFVDTGVSQMVYDAWLNGKVNTPEGVVEGPRTPMEVLQGMVDAEVAVVAPDGSKHSMKVMEGMMMKYVSMALEGNLQAIQGVYKELQHEGVNKTAVAHVDALPAGAEYILNQLGYDPDTGTALSDAPASEGLGGARENDREAFLEGL